MLTKITIRNFKCFNDVEVDLANPVVFIGPNNSGKTSALQALALWEAGLKQRIVKRSDLDTSGKRSGGALNRLELVSVPVPNAKLLWHSLRVREPRKNKDIKEIQSIRIEIIVEGITNGRMWECGFEFDYVNEESFYCRPLRLSRGKNADRMPVPEEAGDISISFLPPMSGLAANETLLTPGAINVRVGEGRTAEVLRNLCYKVYQEKNGYWNELKESIDYFFKISLNDPVYIPARGEIVMSYREKGNLLDLSCSGRGSQQILLLLAYMYANPGAVLLLDEPDAHLEILRQRQIYRFLTRVARKNGNQIIAASHSEVLLNEAAERDTVVAFVGKPHRIDDRGSQLLKSLRDIPFEHFYQAEQTGWVLYLEGATDLEIIQTFADMLGFREAVESLEQPFIHYVGNQPMKALEHFYGLREAVPHLKGIAIFDRLEKNLPEDPNLICMMWKRREIENYFCLHETLEAYARFDPVSEIGEKLSDSREALQRRKVLEECINKIEQAMEVFRKGSPWSPDTKVSDDFLEPLFNEYFGRLGLPNIMKKSNFHQLARFIPKDKIDPEIKEKLEAIVKIARSARSAANVAVRR